MAEIDKENRAETVKPDEAQQTPVEPVLSELDEKEEKRVNILAADVRKTGTAAISIAPLLAAKDTEQSPEFEDKKQAAIDAAVKDTDMAEQIRYGEAPDSPREAADKEFALRTDPVLKDLDSGKQLAIPPQIAKQYVENQNVFFDKNTHKVAIDARSHFKLKTVNNDHVTISNMIALAQANNWTHIKLSGTPEFRREAWAQAKLAGLEVKGYVPTKEEKLFIQAKLAEKNKPVVQNTIEQNHESALAHFKKKLDALKTYAVEHKTKPDPMAQRKIDITPPSPEKEMQK